MCSVNKNGLNQQSDRKAENISTQNGNAERVCVDEWEGKKKKEHSWKLFLFFKKANLGINKNNLKMG